MDNNYTEMCLGRNKNSQYSEREMEEKYYYFLNVIIIDYSRCQQFMIYFLAVSYIFLFFVDFRYVNAQRKFS